MGIPRLDKLAFNRKEAARQMSMSLEEFNDYVNCGSLPAPKVFYSEGRMTERWSRAALEAALDATNVETDEFEP